MQFTSKCSLFIIQLGYCRCLTGDVVCGLPSPHNIFMVPVWNTISNASSRVSRVYENKCENDQWPARVEQPAPRPEGDKYYIFSRIKQRPAPPRPALARRHTTTRLFPDLRKYWETRHFTSIYSPILGTLEKFSAIISKIGI